MWSLANKTGHTEHRIDGIVFVWRILTRVVVAGWFRKHQIGLSIGQLIAAYRAIHHHNSSSSIGFRFTASVGLFLTVCICILQSNWNQ